LVIGPDHQLLICLLDTSLGVASLRLSLTNLILLLRDEVDSKHAGDVAARKHHHVLHVALTFLGLAQIAT